MDELKSILRSGYRIHCSNEKEIGTAKFLVSELFGFNQFSNEEEPFVSIRHPFVGLLGNSVVGFKDLEDGFDTISFAEFMTMFHVQEMVSDNFERLETVL